MKKITKYLFLFVAALAITSCDDYLEIEPIGKVIPETLEEFRAVLTKGYDTYPEHKSLTTFRTDELTMDESKDDLIYYKDIFTWKDTNPDRITATFPYQDLYNTIFYTNVIINEAGQKVAASDEKNQLIGEAYALRALAYFDLINLFAKPYNATTASTDRGVPLALKIDLEQAYVPESVAVIYNQILLDSKEAENLLNKDTQTTGMNYRFSKAALYALESRIYLYQKEWQKALEATEMALTYKSNLLNLNTTPLLANKYDSAESIMALESVFLIRQKEYTFASPELIATYNKLTDLRFGLYFQAKGTAYKFKIEPKEYANQKCSFRTSELYLTKSEAFLQLDNLAQAKTTLLSFIEKRYNPTAFIQLSTEINAMNTADFTNFLYQERQREFAAEGHRWFDLRRTTQKQIIHRLGSQDFTLIQNDPRYTLPFPADARLNNPNL
jgi:hypothetical protein